MTAGVQPAIQRIDLIWFAQAKVGRLSGVKVERAHTFEHEGVVGKDCRQQTGCGWLHCGLLHFYGQETRRKTGRAWKGTEDGSAGVHFLAELDGQLFRSNFPALV